MISMDEHRTEPRMMCADMLKVFWRDNAGKRRQTMALLEDIAASGACLQFESPIPVGAVVEWQSPKLDFRGTVRYCVYREIGYFVGVEFIASTKWSKNVYRPQHLFEPRRLVQKVD
jgi:hypothetical protein